MREIKFGTDGFRAIIADEFTFENVGLIARAIGTYLNNKDPQSREKTVLVVFDRRFLSEQFARSAEKILAECGLRVLAANSFVPTPAASYYVKANKLAAGVLITASHNPAIFNGIKIKNEFGASAEIEVTHEIERIIKQREFFSPANPGSVETVDFITPYLKFLEKFVNMELIRDKKYRIIVDLMHGAGAGIFPEILRGTKCRVQEIRREQDVLFGGVNPEPILSNLSALTKTLKKEECDLAIALDGDADRIGAMCPNGRFINSHYAICLLLLHFIENRKLGGKVVKSINTTTMVNKITDFFGLECEEVPVGFKNIAAKMLTEDILLGGEESGGIGFKNYIPERDGILSGLLLIEMMAYKNSGISEIIREMEKRFGSYAYLRRDLPVKLRKKIRHPLRINDQKVREIKTYDGTKFILEDESWLLIRASGTEPIVRIYAESKKTAQTKQLIEAGCRML